MVCLKPIPPRRRSGDTGRTAGQHPNSSLESCEVNRSTDSHQLEPEVSASSNYEINQASIQLPITEKKGEEGGDQEPPELEPDQADGEDQEEGEDEVDTKDPAKPARLKHVKFVPLESKDPIQEGRDLAESADVKLPTHKPAPKLCTTKPNPTPAPNLPLSEEHQIAELYRQGILYEAIKDEPHWAGFGFDAIHPAAPLYTIRQAPRRKRKPGSGTILGGDALAAFDMLDGDYMSDDVWDLLSQFSDVDAFDFVMLDDASPDIGGSWADSDFDWVTSE